MTDSDSRKVNFFDAYTHDSTVAGAPASRETEQVTRALLFGGRLSLGEGAGNVLIKKREASGEQHRGLDALA